MDLRSLEVKQGWGNLGAFEEWMTTCDVGAGAVLEITNPRYWQDNLKFTTAYQGQEPQIIPNLTILHRHWTLATATRLADALAHPGPHIPFVVGTVIHITEHSPILSTLWLGVPSLSTPIPIQVFATPANVQPIVHVPVLVHTIDSNNGILLIHGTKKIINLETMQHATWPSLTSALTRYAQEHVTDIQALEATLPDLTPILPQHAAIPQAGDMQDFL